MFIEEILDIESHKRLWIHCVLWLETAGGVFLVKLCVFFLIVLHFSTLWNAYTNNRKHTGLFKEHNKFTLTTCSPVLRSMSFIWPCAIKNTQQTNQPTAYNYWKYFLLLSNKVKKWLWIQSVCSSTSLSLCLCKP